MIGEAGRFERAIARPPSPNFGEGITASSLGPPDFELALEQHAAYVEALRSLGIEVILLPAASAFPDGCFVEDTAVVTPRVAVIARPGAPSRRGETDSIEPALARHREIERIGPPGTVDGGDVLAAGDRFFIGLSERTDRAGAGHLASILTARGHGARLVPVGGGLHLKSGVNRIGDGILLATEEFAGREQFASFEKIVVDEEEAYAANALPVKDRLLFPAGFPRTKEKLLAARFRLLEIDVSEFRRMDGGLTCLSIRF